MTAFVRAFSLGRPSSNFLPRASTPRTHAAAAQFSRQKTTMIRGFSNNLNNNSGDGGSNRRVLKELVDFPCVFTFKVIGFAQGNFVGDIVDSVALALETDKKYLETSYRDRGKYRSITLKAPVNTADQIYDVYAAIDRDPRVKFKF